MDKLTRMQTLLPYLAELPHDESTEAFWKAAERNNVYAAVFALLSLFAGEHRRRAYGMASALTGRSIREIIRQPFPIVFRDLRRSLDEDVLMFCYMVSACGARSVARVLYKYRPPCALAIPELILMDRDDLKVSMYACDMLRAFICMFSKDAQSIPTIHEILDPKSSANKHTSAEQALQFVDNMINIFGKKEEDPCKDSPSTKSTPAE